MSVIRTFGELRSELTELVNRNDFTPSLANQFIKDGINRCNRVLGTKVPSFEVATELTADANGYVPIPYDFLKLVSFEDRANPNTNFRAADLTHFRRMVAQGITSTGTPSLRYYTREGLKWRFYPAYSAGDLIDLRYNHDEPTFGEDSESSALLGFAPELVKYAAATFAADHFLDTERATKWDAAFDKIRTEIIEQLGEMEEVDTSFYSHAPDEHY